MLHKQFGALHLYILAAILAAILIVGLSVIFVLDKSMIAKTASVREKQQNRLKETKLAEEQSNPSPTLGAAQNVREIEELLKPNTPTLAPASTTENLPAITPASNTEEGVGTK